MAGSWTEVEYKDGYANGSMNGIKTRAASFVADASDGSIPVLTIDGGPEYQPEGGLMQRVEIVFDSETPPSGAGFTVKVTSAQGAVICNPDGTAITGTGSITCNCSFVGDRYVYLTGNETNSAEGTVLIHDITR